MDIDLSDAVVRVDEETEPEQRQVQELGRVDIPNEMLEAIGRDIGDNVLVDCNKEEGVIKIHNYDEVLEDGL